mmetsp:Transcript_6268/g.23671  ORF Transcript_6268/g.23671 Transcript_6268/m.23671 type:complete len:238 (-) Transcript_6268:267-980(-)
MNHHTLLRTRRTRRARLAAVSTRTQCFEGFGSARRRARRRLPRNRLALAWTARRHKWRHLRRPRKTTAARCCSPPPPRRRKARCRLNTHHRPPCPPSWSWCTLTRAPPPPRSPRPSPVALPVPQVRRESHPEVSTWAGRRGWGVRMLMPGSVLKKRKGRRSTRFAVGPRRVATPPRGSHPPALPRVSPGPSPPPSRRATPSSQPRRRPSWTIRGGSSRAHPEPWTAPPEQTRASRQT